MIVKLRSLAIKKLGLKQDYQSYGTFYVRIQKHKIQMRNYIFSRGQYLEVLRVYSVCDQRFTPNGF